MARDSLRIGSGSGFWGDALEPAVDLVRDGQLDYLGMDFLAELTMALLQRQRVRNPQGGYVSDLVPYLRELLPVARRSGTRIVCNGGGVNPMAAGEAVQAMAAEIGLEGVRIGVVEGDDLLGRMDELLAAGLTLPNLDTGAPDIREIRDRIVAANAYTGAEGIIDALQLGADVVIAGRVSDSALYVGPLMHELGWRFEPEFEDRIGAAITMGHVMECAAGVTGGMSSRWDVMERMGEVGFPYATVRADGSAVLTKVPGTGGRVDEWTIKEHLTYETLDPAAYLAPDGVADFTTVHLDDAGPDQVAMTRMSGRGRPDDLKLVVGYTDGWIGEGMLFFPWPGALGRAEKAKQTILERFDRMGLKARQVHFDYVGVNMLHGPSAPIPTHELNEVGLRVAVHTDSREEADKVRRACSQLWIMGPGGTSFGTPMKPRPVVAAWPTLVPRSFVTQAARVLTVPSTSLVGG